MTGVKFFILLFVLSCLQTMNSEGRSFQDRGNGYTEGPYGEFGPIEVSAGDASFRMTWTSAVCVYGTVALVLLFKGLLFFQKFRELSNIVDYSLPSLSKLKKNIKDVISRSIGMLEKTILSLFYDL